SLINDLLGVELYLSDYVPMQLRKGEMFSFSLYAALEENLGLEFNLVPNQSNFEPPGKNTPSEGLFQGIDVDERTRLVRELPEINFFLLIKGEMHDHYAYEILSRLKKADLFTKVQLLDLITLQSRKNLLF